MVATIIRRKPVLHVLRDKKRSLNETSKTGIHSNDIVNAALDDIEAKAVTSGTGTSTASTNIPLYLQKRRELSASGESRDRRDD